MIERGAWYVVMQAILLGMLFFGPVGSSVLPRGMEGFAYILKIIGQGIFFIGLVIAVIAAIQLGKNLTPLPCPKANSQFVDRGLYKLVRHPIYFGVILIAFGWLLITFGVLTLVCFVALIFFFDIKSRKEEVWLVREFPAYAAYQLRVRKLIPKIY